MGIEKAWRMGESLDFAQSRRDGDGPTCKAKDPKREGFMRGTFGKRTALAKRKR
jgi:hypothetical protein